MSKQSCSMYGNLSCSVFSSVKYLEMMALFSCSMLGLLFLVPINYIPINKQQQKQQHRSFTSTTSCFIITCCICELISKHTNRLYICLNRPTWYRWVKPCTSVRRTMAIVFITITKYAGFAAQEKGNNVTGEVSRKTDVWRNSIYCATTGLSYNQQPLVVIATLLS